MSPKRRAKKVSKTPRFGAHMSAAGGPHTAIERGLAVGCEVLQIFSKNNNQWKAKPLSEEKIEAWNDAWKEASLQAPIAHASYLINLAAPDEALWKKSIAALVDELQRAYQLNLDAVVVHPGAFTTSDEASGIARIIEGVQAVLTESEPYRNVRLLLENTAGQGSCLGCSFEQLGAMLEGIDDDQRVGVCFDTCHAFAAGYPINDSRGCNEMIKEIKDHLPKKSISAVHCNDSKKACGSRVDRHEHIGRGEIGDAGFRNVFSDPLFRTLPGYLETPKGKDEESGEEWDVINLRRLREITH